jgi:predicted nucleic acid-binding protein
MAKREALARVVVCDAGPLIHLDELGAFDLLSDFAEVLVPQAVWQEVARHRPEALQHPGVTLRIVIPSREPSAELDTVVRLFALHPGETQALQVAGEQKVDLLLSDDTAARLAARNLGIPVHGTVGILLRSIRRGQRTTGQVVAVLQSIPTASSLHIKLSLLEQIVTTVQELV